jgi:hypothetical protein
MSIYEPTDEGQSRSSLAAQARQITLQVGERRFVTAHETLVTESTFFASLLSGRWDNALPDGSYFIDADPTLFEHILRYLRRRVLPIFYDIDKGHDHALYLALLEEARYFQIARLEDWLENQQYHRALAVECSVEEVEGTKNLSTTLPTDTGVENHPRWEARKVYVCPRWIDYHRGRPQRCGIKCMKAKGDADTVYEKELVLRLLVVKKRIVLDMQACGLPTSIRRSSLLLSDSQVPDE